MTTPHVQSRRALLGGIGLLFVAPAIVRAASLMPVKVPHTHHSRYMMFYDPSWDRNEIRIDWSALPFNAPLCAGALTESRATEILGVEMFLALEKALHKKAAQIDSALWQIGVSAVVRLES